jgi:hypothetical protein
MFLGGAVIKYGLLKLKYIYTIKVIISNTLNNSSRKKRCLSRCFRLVRLQSG